MRVVITGAAGFIGSHLTRLVVGEGHSVWGVLLPGESPRRLAGIPRKLTLVPLDLRDGNAVEELISSVRPDCTIHLAWYAVPGKYWSATENLDCVAISLSLVQKLASVGCSRLVAAGSCAEYDWAHGFLSENATPLRPRTLYGACKNATREVLEAYCREASINLAWTRFFYLYGPGEPKERLVPSVVRALLGGEKARCTDGEQVRDFLHVEDLASAVWAVTQSDLSGPVNIGSGQPTKIRTIVETLGEIVNARDRLLLGAIPASCSEPPVLVADVRRLTDATGWRPSWSLRAGLQQVVDWWRQQMADQEESL